MYNSNVEHSNPTTWPVIYTLLLRSVLPQKCCYIIVMLQYKAYIYSCGLCVCMFSVKKLISCNMLKACMENVRKISHKKINTNVGRTYKWWRNSYTGTNLNVPILALEEIEAKSSQIVQRKVVCVRINNNIATIKINILYLT